MTYKIKEHILVMNKPRQEGCMACGEVIPANSLVLMILATHPRLLVYRTLHLDCSNKLRDIDKIYDVDGSRFPPAIRETRMQCSYCLGTEGTQRLFNGFCMHQDCIVVLLDHLEKNRSKIIANQL